MTLGEKLSEYRRGAGYSQEELAERLNVSRQAISKWERGEALPDTENLIALADLYGASIDALLGRETESTPTDVENDGIKREETSTLSDESSGKDTIAATDTEKGGDETDNDRRRGRTGDAIFTISVMAATAAFLLWGIIGDAWRISWTCFLLLPVIDSLIDCIQSKKVGKFNFPVLITYVYMMIGLTRGIWHPTWVMFLSIPVFYVLTDCFEKK